MIEVDGKRVLTELDELVAPQHTALVLVDMQRDFVEPDGAFARLGVDVSMYEAMRPRLRQLLEEARRAGVLVVHVQMSSLPGRRSDSPAQIRFNLRMHESAHGRAAPLHYTQVGSRGQEFVDDLAPRADEMVVPKWRSSAFWGTSLDLLLRSNGIETVVVTGCTTEGCVESTARDAMFSDYYVVVAEDCVASDDAAQHDASLFLMRHRFDLALGAEIASTWTQKGESRSIGGHTRSETLARAGAYDGRGHPRAALADLQDGETRGSQKSE
ncbi:cysteine hydrolase family protein [Terrabacter terrigena]|uniref:Cysteine hydrolase family protein n=1 Tax=Terrabacter terrigena TaxID=574718 RepID=A0ABW3N214_9MICO